MCKRRSILGSSAGLLFLGTALAAQGIGLLPAGTVTYSLDQEAGRAGIRAEYGVEIQPLRLSARDSMLDFRYRVLDPAKAAALHRRDLRPYVLDPRRETAGGVPSTRIGSFRQTQHAPKQDVVYTTMFTNPGRKLTRGDQVTIVYGDLVIEHVPIE